MSLLLGTLSVGFVLHRELVFHPQTSHHKIIPQNFPGVHKMRIPNSVLYNISIYRLVVTCDHLRLMPQVFTGNHLAFHVRDQHGCGEVTWTSPYPVPNQR